MSNETTDAFSKAGAEKTFVEKAFEELDALNRTLGNPTPEDARKVALRSCEIIDSYIDRPVEEKEVMKALAILQFGAPFMFDDTTRFKERYNQTLSLMIDDVLADKETTERTQIIMAISIASFEIKYTDALKEIQSPGDPELIAEFEESMLVISTDPGVATQPRLFEKMKSVMGADVQPTPQSAPSAGLKDDPALKP